MLLPLDFFDLQPDFSIVFYADISTICRVIAQYETCPLMADTSPWP